jgi:hypothetical protein
MTHDEDFDPSNYRRYELINKIFHYGIRDAEFDSVNTEKGARSERYVSVGDSASSIQSKIDAVASEVADSGFGVVYGPTEQITLDGTLILPSGVQLRDWDIRVADGTNADVVKTKNFDSLTDTGKISESEVPTNFGLVNVFIDGNKANNTNGTGVKIYGTRYKVDYLYVYDMAGDGFYSEAGSGGIQDWADQPVTDIGFVWTTDCGGDGFVYRGPHDGRIDFVLAEFNTGRGFVLEDTDSDTSYNMDGTVVSHCHTNNNETQPAQVWEGTHYAGWVYPDGDQCEIRGNMRRGSIWMTGGRTTILGESHLNVVGGFGGNSSDTGAALTVSGKHTTIDTVRMLQYPDDAVIVDANGTTINAGRCTDNGGYGLKLGDGGNVTNCNISLNNLNKNDSGAIYYEGGQANKVDLTSYISSGFSGYDTTGSFPTVDDSFDVNFYGDGTDIGRLAQRGVATFSGDGSTTTYTISHDLVGFPRNIQITAATADAQVAMPCYWTDEDGNSFDVVFSTAPADGTDNIEISWRAGMIGQQ